MKLNEATPQTDTIFIPNPDKPEPKRFGRKDAQDSQKIKTLLLCFLPAPSAYECLRECRVCLFAANFFPI